jgi:transposase
LRYCWHCTSAALYLLEGNLRWRIDVAAGGLASFAIHLQFDGKRRNIRNRVNGGRSSALGDRLFVEAVIWKFRSGAPWRDLPERFGDWKNIHKRFSRWAASGVWEGLCKTLADDPDNEYAMIDAAIVRAHQHGAGAKAGITAVPWCVGRR